MMRKALYLRTLEKISELVSEWGKADVFLVGGCIRDSIIGFGIEDIDLVIDMNNGPREFMDWLEKEKIVTNFIVLPRHDTIRFTLIINGKEVQVECVAPRTNFDDPNSNHLLDDALKRDFCCNAIYKNAITGDLIDPTKHGIEDAEKRILRTPIPAEQTFLDDPLRMLRAFRFKAEKKFQILPEVYQYIKPYPEYFQVKIERVREEFRRILKTEKTSEIIRELHTTKLLSYIIPELEEAWGFNQNTHFHSMNLTDYTLNVLDNLWKSDDHDLLGMATLLHDISKYKEWKVIGGEFSYPDHEKKSAEMAEHIMERLKYSKDDIRIVKKIIENHKILKPYYDPLSGRYNGTQKVTRRIVRELGDELKLCLSLINATNISHAASYNKPLQVQSFISSLRMLGRVPILKGCPVSGNDIMREFGLTPGPKIEEVKDVMMDWLDETPELGKEELIEKFKQEYGGKTFWVYKNEYEEIEVTLSEPILGKDGKLITVPYEIPFVLLDPTLKEKKEMWRAEEHPKLFSAVIKFKKSRELFEEAAKLLNRLRQIEGFINVTLNLDIYGDVSGRIDWRDLKPDYIV